MKTTARWIRFLLWVAVFLFFSRQSISWAQPVIYEGNQLLDEFRFHQWATIRKPSIILTYPPKLAEQATVIADEAEKTVHDFQTSWGWQIEQPVHIYLFPDRASLRERFGWEPGVSASGVYYAGAIYLLNPDCWMNQTASLKENPWKWRQIFHFQGPLYHEFAHLYLDQLTRGNYPRWYTEAFAQWVEYRALGYEWKTKANDLRTHQSYSYRNLDRLFDRLPNQALAYRESFLFFRYMVQTKGFKRIDHFHRMLAEGIPFADAWRQCFGRPVEQSFDQWLNQTLSG
ncbi:peptidase MA family metallohydrolase [Polycladomyces subterraneus]|uniref:Peptidase MA-like domain-containing protein n=1 Tax=Polycladomyces subterraneus TaxID=1016997 RepID=A0ABT8IIH0_9BACL|nr:hypothetical protein [Polycladomyces subterraneus]MDN4592586.1 hypothetical protein [Polycladomyces subterraneus]